jgi:manganese/zinc/iron transport system permease protein
MNFLTDIFTDYTIRTVALGSAVLGIVSGALGTFAVLRRQSLLGDAMSHAALPGIALAFLLTASKAPIVLAAGAMAAGWLGTVVIMSIINNTRIKGESAMGLVLSIFFGFGLVLLTFIQRLPNANQAGLDKFLFGQAATLMTNDVLTMTVIGAITLAMMTLFWKELKLLSFDPNYAASAGFPVHTLDILFTSLLVAAIVIGLQTVGVVLMSAMIVAPAVAARQFTDRLGIMVMLSAVFGALAGISGAIISGEVRHLPTGPTIVLCISAIVGISLVIAPNRGLLWGWLRHREGRRKTHLEGVLRDLFILASQHPGAEHGHSAAVLKTMSTSKETVQRSLKTLEARELVKHMGDNNWVITPDGIRDAKKTIEERNGIH